MAPRLCIVSLYAYPLFDPTATTPFGGSEVRVASIAKALARRGALDVSVVTFDHDRPVQQLDGVRVVPWRGRRYLPPPEAPPPPKPRSKLQVAKVKLKRALGLRPPPLPSVGHIGRYPVRAQAIALYDELDADVLLVHGNTELSAELAFHCERAGRPFVFLAGSDLDYSPLFKTQPDPKGRFGPAGELALYTIARAHTHIAQTEAQARLLSEHYGREARVIPNPIALERAFPREPVPGSILWIGKADRIKRPELALQIARALPELRFTLISSDADPAIGRKVRADAAALPNVELLDYVPFGEVERYFARTETFLSTSAFEGFPNTFLQAAKYAVPIVSMAVDPARMLSEHGAGILTGEAVEPAIAAIERLARAPRERAERGEAALAYVRAHHDQARVAEAIEAIVLEAARR